jgi:hypothetical protein
MRKKAMGIYGKWNGAVKDGNCAHESRMGPKRRGVATDSVIDKLERNKIS